MILMAKRILFKILKYQIGDLNYKYNYIFNKICCNIFLFTNYHSDPYFFVGHLVRQVLHIAFWLVLHLPEVFMFLPVICRATYRFLSVICLNRNILLWGNRVILSRVIVGKYFWRIRHFCCTQYSTLSSAKHPICVFSGIAILSRSSYITSQRARPNLDPGRLVYLSFVEDRSVVQIVLY